MSFAFEIEVQKRYPVIRLEGSLIERYEAAGLLDEVDEYISSGQVTFVIDLKKLDYLNSSGLNVLLNVLTRTRNAGGEAIICNVSPKLKKLLIITKLDAVFSLATNKAMALKILNEKGKSTNEHGT